jgi:hypothetical protein
MSIRSVLVFLGVVLAGFLALSVVVHYVGPFVAR